MIRMIIQVAAVCSTIRKKLNGLMVYPVIIIVTNYEFLAWFL
jgi:hypothetical protein